MSCKCCRCTPLSVAVYVPAGRDKDLQWQYLYHQVYHNCSTQQQLHTQLGLVMISAITQHLPSSTANPQPYSQQPLPLQQPQPQQQEEGEGEQPVGLTSAQLAAMIHQLPLLFAPNFVAAVVDSSSSAPGQQESGLTRGTSMLFTSAAGQLGYNSSSKYGVGKGLQGGSMMGGWGVGGGMPSASAVAASMSRAHIGGSGSQQLPVAAIDAAVAAAAGAGGTDAVQQGVRASQHHGPHHHQQQYQQQHAHLPTLHEQRQQGPSGRQQQQHFGALAGRAVQPSRQRLQQQQQGLGSFGLLSLSGTSGVRQRSRQGGSRDLGAPPPAAPSGHFQQQQQQQQGGHAHNISRQLSSIAELLLQQQHQQHQQQQGVQTGAQLQAGASAAGAAAGVVGQQQQHPGIRALPLGLGPWPMPTAAAEAEVVDTDSSAGDVTMGAGGPFAAAAATAAVVDKVLLLRCLLVYHLQASLLYDAQVGFSGGTLRV